jgi:serine/threonine protein kinase
MQKLNLTLSNHEKGSVVGTPIHMPPEIFVANYDQGVDIYAFGILLWYLLRNSAALPKNFNACVDKEMLWREVRKGIRPERIKGCNR